MGKAQPLLPVVVAVAEKMFPQKHLQLGPHRSRKRQHNQQQQCQEEHAKLQGAAPFAAEKPHVIPDARNKNQVDAGNQQRCRMKGGLARNLYLGNPVVASRARQHQQRDHQGVHRAANAQGIGVKPVEQDTLGVQVHIEQGSAGQAQAQWLDVPLRVLGDVSKQLLHQHQHKHRQRHGTEQHQARRVSQKGQSEKRQATCEQAKRQQKNCRGNQPAHTRRQHVAATLAKQQQQKAKPEAVTQQVGQIRSHQHAGFAHGQKRQAKPAPQGAGNHGRKNATLSQSPDFAVIAELDEPQGEYQVTCANEAVAPGRQ